MLVEGLELVIRWRSGLVEFHRVEFETGGGHRVGLYDGSLGLVEVVGLGSEVGVTTTNPRLPPYHPYQP